jgi:hypothetical protein
MGGRLLLNPSCNEASPSVGVAFLIPGSVQDPVKGKLLSQFMRAARFIRARATDWYSKYNNGRCLIFCITLSNSFFGQWGGWVFSHANDKNLFLCTTWRCNLCITALNLVFTTFSSGYLKHYLRCAKLVCFCVLPLFDHFLKNFHVQCKFFSFMCTKTKTFSFLSPPHMKMIKFFPIFYTLKKGGRGGISTRKWKMAFFAILRFGVLTPKLNTCLLWNCRFASEA